MTKSLTSWKDQEGERVEKVNTIISKFYDMNFS